MRASAFLVASLLVGCADPRYGLPEVSQFRSRGARRVERTAPKRVDDDWLRAPPPPLPADPPREHVVVERTLASGIRVLVAERRDFPSVHLAFVLDRGTCDGGGAASLYAAALGSSPGEDLRENYTYLHDITASVSRSVSDDAVVLSASVLPPLVASAVSKLAPMFLAPGLLADDIAFARDLRKRALSGESAARNRRAERNLRQRLFGHGAYGNVLVDASDIDATSDDQVREFRRAALSSRHVTVVAAGAISPEVLVGLLELYTKDLPRGDVGVSTCSAFPAPSITGEIHVLDEPGAQQSRVRIGAVGVPVGHRDGPGLDVLSAALVRSLSTRLDLTVRDEHGLSSSVHVTSNEWRANGLVEISTSVETARTADVVKGLLSELDRAATDPLDDGALRRAKVMAVPDLGAHRDELASLLSIAPYGLSHDARELRSRAIAASTADDLTRVAAKYLSSSRRVVTIVGDARKISRELDQLGMGPVVVGH